MLDVVWFYMVLQMHILCLAYVDWPETQTGGYQEEEAVASATDRARENTRNQTDHTLEPPRLWRVCRGFLHLECSPQAYNQAKLDTYCKHRQEKRQTCIGSLFSTILFFIFS